MPPGDSRTREQLRQHYEVERELSDRLRQATPAQRRLLYGTVYKELRARVPLHPMHTRQTSPEERAQAVRDELLILSPFLRPSTVFLEVGPGDYALATAVAARVVRVLAVDVSDEILCARALPENVRPVLSDGSSILVEPGSVDVAYSNQMMEHVHPDDALEQLRQLYAALKRGGVYICITPHRLTGPHDISGAFDVEASGLHLKEYTAGELAALFRAVGFTRVRCLFGGRGRFVQLPAWPALICETLLGRLPAGRRKAVACTAPFRWLLNLRLVGFKG